MPWEREQAIETVKRVTGKSHFFVEIDGDSLVIYWLDQNAKGLERCASIFGAPLHRAEQHLVQQGHFRPSCVSLVRPRPPFPS